MSSPTAALSGKAARAAQLRTDAQTLEKDISTLTIRLSSFGGRLRELEETRRSYGEAAAAGHPPKASALASLEQEISAARLPVDSLQKQLTEKQSALASTREELQPLDRAIAAEEENSSRIARFQHLEQSLREVRDRIDSKLSSLIEEDLPMFDGLSETIAREYIGKFTTNGKEITPEGPSARELLSSCTASFFDNAVLAAERRLLRKGWAAGPIPRFEIRFMQPPKPKAQ